MTKNWIIYYGPEEKFGNVIIEQTPTKKNTDVKLIL